MISRFTGPLSNAVCRVSILVAICLVTVPSLPAQQKDPFNSSQKGYPRWSPFSELRWEADKPAVKVDDQWYGLVSIHGVSIDGILQKCKTEGWDAKKRITEDLVQVLRLMGQDIEQTTVLQLRNDDGEIVTMNDVLMTEENRKTSKFSMIANDPAGHPLRKMMEFENPFDSGAEGYPMSSVFQGISWHGDVPTIRIDDQWYVVQEIAGLPLDKIRQHCAENRFDFRKRFFEDHVQLLRLMGKNVDSQVDLIVRDGEGNVQTLKNVSVTDKKRDELMLHGKTLTREQVREDLAAFRKALEDQFAYLNANDNDYVSAIHEIARDIPEYPDCLWLGNRLQKVIGLFIDGHARVDRGLNGMEDGFLPFLIAPSGERFVAFHDERRDLLDKDFPFIRSIDGMKLQKWIDATDEYVADGSPQMCKLNGLRLTRHVEHFRKRLGLESGKDLVVELVSRDGKSNRTMKLPIGKTKPIYADWPESVSPGLIADDQFGYLPITSMDDDAVESIRNWMPKFAETQGLIVDVRGNGGGSRRALLELAAHLMISEDEPRVANVCKYRLSREFDADHLSRSRFVYRIDSKKFDERDRKAITAFQQSFHPEWSPESGKFSEWHYLVLSKTDTDSRFDYKQHVVILMDEWCFSATDIFLGAFKGWPNVTLVGSASGGGSARSQRFSLPHSDVRVACASMASFQPDGKLYDTNGIQPDVVVERPPEYYLRDQLDVVKEQAIEILKHRNQTDK